MKFATAIEHAAGSGKSPCECGTASLRIDGLCLNCLFRATLDEADSAVATGSLDQILAEITAQRPRRLIGDYEIIDEIGRGGMAVIYRARHISSGQIVALKRVLAGRLESPQAIARFRREAQIAASLVHPNIVPIYHVGDCDDGVPFFAMKLAPRGSLVQSRAKLYNEISLCVQIVLKVALAVEHAHSRAILHRDLKPWNILIDEEGEPLVSDFGIAKWQNDSSQLTRTFGSLGTPGYWAPEQAPGSFGDLTAAADVYSLGAILFELLTGRLPFAGEYPPGMMHKGALNPVPRLRKLRRDADRDLEKICARCLERGPSDRYQSAAEFAQDLSSWLDGNAIRVDPLHSTRRLGRWIRRNILVTTLGGLLAVTIAVTGWYAHNRHDHFGARHHPALMPSVAVLPVLNLDRLTVDVPLGQSIAKSLASDSKIAKTARLKSTQPDSSAYYATPEEGRQLCQRMNCGKAIGVTERTVGDKRRFGIRVLDGATGEPLFVRFLEESEKRPSGLSNSGVFNRQLHGILPSAIAQASKSPIDPGLLNQKTKEAILASRDLMLRYTTIDLDRAIALLQKVVQEVPNSALAHSYLATAAVARTHYIADWSYLDLARKSATTAVSLAPMSGDAHRALAGTYYQEGRLSDALEQGMQTVEIAGLSDRTAFFLGMALAAVGRPDRALTWLSVACRLSRTPGDFEAQIGDCWVQLGDDQQALAAYARSQQLQPNHPMGAVGICHARMLQHDFKGAREYCRVTAWNNGDLGDSKAIAAQIEFFGRRFDQAQTFYDVLAAKDENGGGSFYGAVSYQSALGRSKQAVGDVKAGSKILERCLVTEMAAVERQPENPEPVYRLAAIESSVGKLDRSIEHLRKAVELGWIDYRSLTLDPRFDAVRPMPAFQRIVSDLSRKMAEMRVKIHE